MTYVFRSTTRPTALEEAFAKYARLVEKDNPDRAFGGHACYAHVAVRATPLPPLKGKPKHYPSIYAAARLIGTGASFRARVYNIKRALDNPEFSAYNYRWESL